MLRWALIFLVVALTAGVLGSAGIAGAAMGIAKLLFYVFVARFLVSLIMHLARQNNNLDRGGMTPVESPGPPGLVV
jgi:uncharacterized membrane protein YtjA (UPF0391 family)